MTFIQYYLIVLLYNYVSHQISGQIFYNVWFPKRNQTPGLTHTVLEINLHEQYKKVGPFTGHETLNNDVNAQCTYSGVFLMKGKRWRLITSI